jgi:putative copper resistance protein D
MDISLWSLLTLVGRLILYASVASAIGGVFCSILLARHRDAATGIAHYTGYGCVSGILIAIYSLFIQLGALADHGIAGMIDTTILSVLVKTSVGQALLFEVLGFLLIGIPVWVSLGKHVKNRIPSLLLSFTGGLFLLASFSQVGHLAEATWVGKMAISLHVLAMSLWIGSLYPLWLVSRTSDITAIQTSMETFGRFAIFIVGVLVICGVAMGVILIQNIQTLVTTDYGRGLLLKVMFVGVLLMLAARNKWLTVPYLTRDGFSQRLSRAIALEMLLAGCIFLITGVITWIIGID